MLIKWAYYKLRVFLHEIKYLEYNKIQLPTPLQINKKNTIYKNIAFIYF